MTNKNRANFKANTICAPASLPYCEIGGLTAASSAGAPLRYLRHAFAVQIHFADAFYPREDVIHGLAAESYQFCADNARHEITRQIQNLLRCRPGEPLAENRRHRPSKRLHFRA